MDNGELRPEEEGVRLFLVFLRDLQSGPCPNPYTYAIRVPDEGELQVFWSLFHIWLEEWCNQLGSQFNGRYE